MLLHYAMLHVETVATACVKLSRQDCLPAGLQEALIKPYSMGATGCECLLSLARCLPSSEPLRVNGRALAHVSLFHVFFIYRGNMAETHREGRLGFEDTLNFANTLCVAYTLCSAIRRGWIRRGIYGIDDLVVAAATFSTLGFFAANYVALEHGAGKPWHYIEAAHDVASFNRVRSFH
jgi:hypothetical protein